MLSSCYHCYVVVCHCFPFRLLCDNYQGMSLDERSAIYSAMASTLAALHSARVPSLLASKFGRLDNYCKRQV